jgi:serine/threonine protein kinase/Tfp pilus assembly protein PilF
MKEIGDCPQFREKGPVPFFKMSNVKTQPFHLDSFTSHYIDFRDYSSYYFSMGKEEKSAQCAKCYTLNPEDSQFCSKCGSALEIFQETLSYSPDEEAIADELIQFKPGDIFDKRYRIIEEIGRGGMGRVYKAEDTELNITVALKIIRPRFSSHLSFIERFKKETLLARSISHDNVIRIHDLGEADNIKYISMEYIKGQNLRDFIQSSGSLSADTVANLSRQMCEALKAAHKKGILHQDLKPSNIMIDNSGQAYIMDFGLARSLFTRDTSLKKGVTGTPQYMSPEQAEGKKLDKRSDVYALGTIMYEMVTGKPLFDGSTKEELYQKHISETPKPPSKINPSIPHLLDSIILKSLEKDREKRYQRVEEIISDLDKLKSQPLLTSFANWLKRYWYVPSTAILALLIITSIILWKKTSLSPLSKGKRISLAITYLMNNTGDKNLDYMGKTFSELLIADLLQSQHIRVITGDRLYDVLKALDLLESSFYSSEDLKQIATSSGVDYILQGNFSKEGDFFRVNTSIHETSSMEPIGAERVEGNKIESIFSMVDGLTRKIKEDFNLSPEDIARDIDKDVMNITTNSPEAMKHYIEGKLLFKEYDFEKSIQALEKAIDLDPEFALAYVKLSEDYFYLVNAEQGERFLSKALSLLNKVSDREFYLIQSYAAFTSETQMESFQKLLELYPDDIEAATYLAARYRNLEEWDQALNAFEKVIEIDPQDDNAYENIAFIYMAKGLYKEAWEFLKTNEHMVSDKITLLVRLGTAYLCGHKYDQALEEVNTALSLAPDSYTVNELKGHIHQISGDLESSEESYRTIAEMDYFMYQYMGRLWVAHLHLMKGEYEWVENEVIKILEEYQKINFLPGVFNFKILCTYIELQGGNFSEALDLSAQALEAANEANFQDYIYNALYFRGLTYAKMKRFKETRETAEKLKRRIEDSENKKNMRYYHQLNGEIARAGGDISQAIEDFETVLSLLPAQHLKSDIHILFFDSLASAYLEKQDLKKAQKEYEKILTLTTGRLRWGDKYSLAYYHLGKIHQVMGDEEKSREYYNEFLELWGDANPNLNEILDAKEQITALGGMPQKKQ